MTSGGSRVRQQTPCRTFPLSAHVKRCFIRSVMPLQPTDRATQEDTTVCGTLPSKWRPVWSNLTCYLTEAKTQFQLKKKKQRIYSGDDSRTTTLLCWQGKGGKCANCCFFLSWFHSFCRVNLFCTCHHLKQTHLFYPKHATFFFFFFCLECAALERHVVRLCMNLHWLCTFP